MVSEDKEDWCQCGGDTPINWLGKCEKCGKDYLFPDKRLRVLHPLPFSEAKEILIAIVTQDKECKHWRGISDKKWDGAFLKLLDAGFLSIEKGYFLLGASIFCNPRLYGTLELYFTSKKGAKLWKKLKFSGALYSLDVCKKE